MGIIIFCGCYLIASVMNIVAAVKIWKWLTVPYILIEFIRLCAFMACHVLLMMIFKKQLNLGVLITACSAGGFVLLYLAYMWSCSIALFQIISVVNSKEYQKILSMGSPAPENLSRKNFIVSSIPNSKQLEAERKHAGIFASDFSEFNRRPQNFRF